MLFFFPMENIALEIMLRICYNKPVKVLLTLMDYCKILHVGVVERLI